MLGTEWSRYYSEDNEFDSVSMTSVATTTTINGEEQGREQEGTFGHHLNQKITLPKLNDVLTNNDLWIWLADAQRYIDSGCSMGTLENEIDKNLLNGFWGVWFHQCRMLSDSIIVALSKMKQTDHHEHSDGLLQEFYAMTQKHNESIGKNVVRLDMATAKSGSSLKRLWVAL